MGIGQIHERLRRAIADWHGNDRGERRFAREMQLLSEKKEAAGERPIPGTSRPMIQRYLSGENVPPVEFLVAAAELLHVRFEYLATGEGGRTTAEHIAMLNTNRKENAHWLALSDGLWKYAFDQAHPMYAPGQWGWHSRAAVINACMVWRRRLLKDLRPAKDLSDEELPARLEEARQLGERFGRIFAYPFHELGVSLETNSEALLAYAEGMSSVLVALAHSFTPQGDPAA
jgi:transcriptional regulator with XRE-family HTH domain